LVPCWFRYLPFAAPRSGGRLSGGPEGPLTGQGFGRFVAPPERVEFGVRCMAWSGLGPGGLWSVRPARRRAPRGPPLPSTRLPPGGGCAVGALVCRTRRFGRSKGRARGGRPRAPSGRLAVPPRRCASAFAPAAGASAVGRRPEGRWLSGCRWLQVPDGSVAAVRGSRRSLVPWCGARWVRRAVGGTRRCPSPWSGPVDPSAGGGPGESVAAVRGSRRSLSPWVGARWVRRPGAGARWVLLPWRWGSWSVARFRAPEGVLPRGWGRWVRRAVRGARRRPSPWLGPGGSVARFGAPEGVLPRGSGPGGSVAVAQGP